MRHPDFHDHRFFCDAVGCNHFLELTWWDEEDGADLAYLVVAACHQPHGIRARLQVLRSALTTRQYASAEVVLDAETLRRLRTVLAELEEATS